VRGGPDAGGLFGPRDGGSRTERLQRDPVSRGLVPYGPQFPDVEGKEGKGGMEEKLGPAVAPFSLFKKKDGERKGTYFPLFYDACLGRRKKKKKTTRLKRLSSCNGEGGKGKELPARPRSNFRFWQEEERRGFSFSFFFLKKEKRGGTEELVPNRGESKCGFGGCCSIGEKGGGGKARGGVHGPAARFATEGTGGNREENFSRFFPSEE